jgi:hypothetical protein
MQAPAFACVMPPRAMTGIFTETAALLNISRPSGGRVEVLEIGAKIGASRARSAPEPAASATFARWWQETLTNNGYIGSIIYQHSRSTFHGANASRPCRKLARHQLRLANLHEIDAFPHPAFEIFKPGRGTTGSGTVRNQITDHKSS